MKLEPWYHVAKAVALPPVKLWFTWRFEGLENIPARGPAIVACNHVSYLDPLCNALAVIKAGRRPRFLAKDDLFQIPLVGTALRGAGQIPVDRARSGDPSPLLAAETALRAGEIVVIYPEGTVTKNPDFTPMRGKSGAVRLALATGAPIVPVASWGSQAVWQKSGKGSLKFGRPVWVKAGTPIDLSANLDRTGDGLALRELTDGVMAEIAALVEDLRARYPKRWSTPR
ncbi:MAG: 1-acyl-sn-glycerol-3-phosphate acyltransferase [Actinobacteria bacterium]|nr:1-acyl-sn-glycerol-3-phosphate acyltransferase [Actinomycetota bacterium]